VNIDPGSIPSRECLNFPATCLDVEAGRSIDRFSLFHEILKNLLFWRARFSSALFLRTWESHLAYRDQIVEVSGSTDEKRTGQVEGLEWDGSLRLRRPDGEKFMVQFGDVHLLPVL
jgi:biotin-(acetyl-CoA carboxylase) ligase